MDNREFFIERWEAEQRAFLNVLRAVPDGQLQYKPHERSTAAGALAWQIADEQRQLIELLDAGEVHIKPTTHPDTSAAIAKEYDDATNNLRGRLKSMTPEKWTGPAQLVVDGKVVWKDTVANFFWGFLFDMVHHRGQLSAYLRPMGGKVPAIYGPSADDSGS